MSTSSDPEKVKNASLRDKTIAAGTAQDKVNILTGRPTGITENRVTGYVEPDALRKLARSVRDMTVVRAKELPARTEN